MLIKNTSQAKKPVKLTMFLLFPAVRVFPSHKRK